MSSPKRFTQFDEDGAWSESDSEEKPFLWAHKIPAAKELLKDDHTLEATQGSHLRLLSLPSSLSCGGSDINKKQCLRATNTRKVYQSKLRAIDSVLWSQNTRLVYARSRFKSKREWHHESLFVNLGGPIRFQQSNNLIPLHDQMSERGQYCDPNIGFDSRFEGGNLHSVVRVSDMNYNLFLNNDINTTGFTQWFNFRVYCSRDHTCRLNICNLYKARTPEVKSMKPVFRTSDTQWRLIPGDVEYQENHMIAKERRPRLHTLSFSLELKAGKIYELAYSVPYTITQLRTLITELRAKKLPYLKTRVIATSLAKVEVIMIEINQGDTEKEVVWIIGRQHSGESPSSFVALGVIQSLVSDSPEAQFLRSSFNFKIVPVVNVDGVVNGNYRANLSGQDLNRVWDAPLKSKHPEVSAIKGQIVIDGSRVKMVLDLHAHSKKLKSFFYGSPSTQNNRLFPQLCCQVSPMFSSRDCCYSIHNNKQGTARAVLSRCLPRALVYTYEVSFMGEWKGDQITCYQTSDYLGMGSSLIRALFMMSFYQLKLIGQNVGNLSSRSHAIIQLVSEVERRVDRPAIQEHSDGVGSDSDPEQGILSSEELSKHCLLDSRLKPRVKVEVWRPTNRAMDSESRQLSLILTKRRIRETTLFSTNKSQNPLQRKNIHSLEIRSQKLAEDLANQSKLESCLILSFDEKSRSTPIHFQTIMPVGKKRLMRQLSTAKKSCVAPRRLQCQDQIDLSESQIHLPRLLRNSCMQGH